MTRPSPSPRRTSALLLAALAVLAQVVLGALALARADGVVQLEPGGTSYHTEFADPAFLHLGWLVLPLIGVAAARWWLGGLLALAGTVAVHAVVATEEIRRWQESGWASGLEILSYLVPVGMLVLGGVAWIVGLLAGRDRSGHRGSSVRPS